MVLILENKQWRVEGRGKLTTRTTVVVAVVFLPHTSSTVLLQ